MGRQIDNKTDSAAEETCLEYVLDYLIHQENRLLMRLQAEPDSPRVKRELLEKARQQLAQLRITGATVEAALKTVERYLWGYYVLDDLISDSTISDIKCYSYNKIRIKRFGVRADAALAFLDETDYKRFVQMVAVKNQINLSAANAVQVFTDHKSNPFYRLRIDIVTGHVSTTGHDFIHIRKIPKQKETVARLIEKGFMTEEQAEYLVEQAKHASGILFTGKGASGKTTLMNALLEEIPQDKSGTVIQESDELFSQKHSDLLFLHTIQLRGESRVQLDLKQLTTQALVMDNDYIIVGEIKGDEAADIMKACYTGHQCWASGHGMSAADALYKFADYVKQATTYQMEECLKLLTGFGVVVFLKDWQVAEIQELLGVNDKGEIQMREVCLRKPQKQTLQEQTKRFRQKIAQGGLVAETGQGELWKNNWNRRDDCFGT